jgi:P27 family predicted phage terminase small subunit
MTSEVGELAGKPGRSGRRKQPASLKIAKGTLRKKRDADVVPLADAGLPPIPKDLHPKAKAEWSRLAPICAKAGLLKSADWLAWELGFRAYDTWLRTSVNIDKAIKESGNGFPPRVAIAQKAYAAVMQFCREFGLTPSARSGLQVGELPGAASADDPMAKVIDQ